MIREDKQLLLQDLCARLPYGVIVDYKENEFETPHWKITTIYPNTFDGRIGYDKRVGAGSESGSRPFHIGEVKPYLRPMSSMTEEEQKEFVKFHCVNICPIIITEDLTISNEAKMFEWLNKHHFDYRCLIEKGLAIAVTENDNPYKG